MRITGLGVIDEAVLEFGPGLTVVTGETGAGKTMVVTGLALLTGARADTGLVRTEARRALVEGRFRVEPTGGPGARLTELGGELDDGDVMLVSRSIGSDARSRAHAGGQAVPISALAELTDELVTVHGQSDQLRLLRPSVQRATLDSFAGTAVSEPLATYAEKYVRYRDGSAWLDEVTTQGRERAQEADLLRFGLAEVDAVKP